MADHDVMKGLEQVFLAIKRTKIELAESIGRLDSKINTLVDGRYRLVTETNRLAGITTKVPVVIKGEHHPPMFSNKYLLFCKSRGDTVHGQMLAKRTQIERQYPGSDFTIEKNGSISWNAREKSNSTVWKMKKGKHVKWRKFNENSWAWNGAPKQIKDQFDVKAMEDKQRYTEAYEAWKLAKPEEFKVYQDTKDKRREILNLRRKQKIIASTNMRTSKDDSVTTDDVSGDVSSAGAVSREESPGPIQERISTESVAITAEQATTPPSSAFEW